MPKHPSPQRVKRHQIYTVWEAADAVGVHRQTVIRWIKDKGLSADMSRRPWLIECRCSGRTAQTATSNGPDPQWLRSSGFFGPRQGRQKI